MSKILRVNMTDRSAVYEEVPDAYRTLAGRGLTSTLVCEEVPADCHPLGPNNKVVLAPGITTGTAAPTASRLSVGAKSPLTGGIKESNVGSVFPYQQARMGIKAIVIEGQPEDDRFWVLKVTMDGATFEPADDLMGVGLYEMAPRLYEKYGNKVGFMTVGPAGEFKMAMAGVCFNDSEGRPSRYAGRGGLGAVVGSKGLKAIVLDPEGAPGVDITDQELFNTGRKKMVDALMTHAITKPKGALNTYGTAVLINIMNEAGGLPTRNFRTGRFEGAAKTGGEAIFENNKTRLGKELYNHACSPGCVIQCSNTYYAEDGSEIVSCLEYESSWAFGADCGIDDLDGIGKLIYWSNAYGVDTIETGVCIGVAMDSGYIPFGDLDGAIALMHEMGKGTPMGRILGGGTAFVAKAFGNPRSPSVKGQGMPAYEPRAVKGIGVTYATSTMGADHTSGYTIAPEIAGVGGKSDPLASEPAKADLSRAFQMTTAFLDSTGHCLFIAFAILDIASGFEGMVQEVNAMYGLNMTGDEAVALGGEILKRERAFNIGAGLTHLDDRLPEFMKYEKLPPHNVVNDLPDEVFDSVHGKM